MICPSCKGKGDRETPAFVDYADGSGDMKNVLLRCHVCDGAGNATPEDIERYRRGQEHRRARINRGESLFECGKRLGMSSAEVCAMEMGKRGAREVPGE